MVDKMDGNCSNERVELLMKAVDKVILPFLWTVFQLFALDMALEKNTVYLKGISNKLSHFEMDIPYILTISFVLYILIVGILFIYEGHSWYGIFEAIRDVGAVDIFFFFYQLFSLLVASIYILLFVISPSSMLFGHGEFSLLTLVILICLLVFFHTLYACLKKANKKNLIERVI